MVQRHSAVSLLRRMKVVSRLWLPIGALALVVAACSGGATESTTTAGAGPAQTAAAAGDEPTTTAEGVTRSALPSFTAADYVVFAQAQTDDSDVEAGFSGSTNHYFGRIHSNNNTESNGSDECFYYPGGTNPFPAFTYGNSHSDSGNNDYGPVMGAGCDMATDGTGEPAQSNNPPFISGGWPGNLSQLVDGSNQMNVDLLKDFCTEGDLENGDDITVTGDGVWCVGPGKKISLGDSGLTATVTLLANDGLIDVGGQNANLTPAIGNILVFSDSDDDQFPIKMSGSDWTSPSGVLFSSRSGIDVSGSDDIVCVQLIAQEVKVQGSNNVIGPLACGAPPPTTTTTTTLPPSTTTTTLPPTTTTLPPATTTTTLPPTTTTTLPPTTTTTLPPTTTTTLPPTTTTTLPPSTTTTVPGSTTTTLPGSTTTTTVPPSTTTTVPSGSTTTSTIPTTTTTEAISPTSIVPSTTTTLATTTTSDIGGSTLPNTGPQAPIGPWSTTLWVGLMLVSFGALLVRSVRDQNEADPDSS